jgi:hypothetical protein
LVIRRGGFDRWRIGYQLSGGSIKY